MNGEKTQKRHKIMLLGMKRGHNYKHSKDFLKYETSVF